MRLCHSRVVGKRTSCRGVRGVRQQQQVVCDGNGGPCGCEDPPASTTLPACLPHRASRDPLSVLTRAALLWHRVVESNSGIAASLSAYTRNDISNILDRRFERCIHTRRRGVHSRRPRAPAGGGAGGALLRASRARGADRRPRARRRDRRRVTQSRSGD